VWIKLKYLGYSYYTTTTSKLWL